MSRRTRIGWALRGRSTRSRLRGRRRPASYSAADRYSAAELVRPVNKTTVF